MEMFYIFLLIADRFLSFRVFSKKLKPKGKLSENHGKNICRIFIILVKFLFIKWQIYELNHDLPNNLRLWKLRNVRKNSEILRTDEQVFNWPPKRQVLTVVLQN